MISYDTMIPKLNFEFVQLGISLLLSQEMQNQKEIFLNLGNTEQEFLNDYNINFSNGLYFPKDLSEFPLANIYFEKCENRDDNDQIATFLGTYLLNIDLYCFRKDALQSDGVTIIDGSNGADKRMNYMIAQVYKTMESQVNNKLGDLDLIDGFSFRGFTKDVNHPNTNVLSFDAVPLFSRMLFEIKITEEKFINIGNTISEFLFTLEMDEQQAGQLLINGV